jgi:hypothetical protein
VGLVAAAPAVISAACGSSDDDNWPTYRNDAFHFAIDYPADWDVQIRNPMPSDDFLHLAVTLQGSEDKILAAVNFYGGWCETHADFLEQSMEVNGVSGVHYECSAQPGGPPTEIVRYFDDAMGQDNYTILNLGVSDVDTTRRIIESFRFLD